MSTMSAQDYIRRIRNPRKKSYAVAYLKFIQEGMPEGKEPDRGELAYMAAQAVRLELTTILKGK